MDNIADKYKREYKTAITREKVSEKYRKQHGLGSQRPRNPLLGGTSSRKKNKTVATGRITKPTTTNRFKKRKVTKKN